MAIGNQERWGSMQKGEQVTRTAHERVDGREFITTLSQDANGRFYEVARKPVDGVDDPIQAGREMPNRRTTNS